jgi:hypothetical protein|tara:strand:+ start:104 stop:679 length:576 start_codon:yes stop_codon:yes gene_type:complete
MTTTKKRTTTKAASLELPKYPFAFEVLDLVSRQRSKAKKVEVLKKYEHPSLKAVFIWNFDETIKSALPPGDVPYSGFEDQATYSGSLTTKIDEEVRKMHETGSFSMGTSDSQGRTTIRREYKNFYHFVKGGNDSMSGVRRETMFINVLEGLHPLEAEIVCLIKDKKLSDKYKITKEVVAEAYPDINWGGRS